MEMPFVHPDLEYVYVDLDHPCMVAAKAQAETSSCFKQRTGAVITDFTPTAERVPENWIVASGTNAVAFPQESCPRQNMETGTGYHLCFDLCGGNLHAEVSALLDLRERLYPHDGHELGLFLYGHWWCCENCCNHMVAAGVTKVFLLEGADAGTVWF